MISKGLVISEVCASSPSADDCAGSSAYAGAVLAGDTGAEVVKHVLLPLNPAVVAVVAVGVYLPDTALHDPSHPLGKVTGIWPTLTARRNKCLAEDSIRTTSELRKTKAKSGREG